MTHRRLHTCALGAGSLASPVVACRAVFQHPTVPEAEQSR
jgi:hypothetical protein